MVRTALFSWLAGATLVLAVFISLLALAVLPAQAAQGGEPGAPIPNQYIVTLKDNVTDVRGAANAITHAHGGQLLHVYTAALHGFALNIPDGLANALRQNPSVASVVQDTVVHIDSTTQANATWGLDRIDQQLLPLSTTYSYDATGAGVNAYVIDTGIHATHNEFTGRVGNGFTVGTSTDDCNGHGTHVSGTIGGTTYGVAKGVTIHPVRVIGCSGSGPISDILAGIDWVTANHASPAVANMSLGVISTTSTLVLNTAVENSIASGVTYVVAAGNNNRDACDYIPSSAPDAITVGAAEATDTPAYFSNFGPCVDLYAPGVGITSAWYTSDTAINTISGTSMATPHVVGVAALYLETHPTATPAEVTNAVLANGTPNTLSGIENRTPNILLQSLWTLPLPPPPPPTGPDVTAPSVPGAARVIQSPQGATVAWNASVDDTAVVGYKVYKGGVFLGQTTSLSYADGSTVPGSTYTYTVSAIDAAGNESAQSAPLTITTSQFVITRSLYAPMYSVTFWIFTPNLSTASVTVTKKNGAKGAPFVGTDNRIGTYHAITVTGLNRWTEYLYTIQATRSGGVGSATLSGGFRTSQI
jgi:subtilisin family serine protease